MNVAALLHPEPAPPRLFAQPAPPSPLVAPTPLPVSKTITRPPLPRSPSPPSLGARVHLGTYLYPHLPFPYSHIPPPEERTVTLSVVVRRATAELALAPNARADPSLWGGAASQPARVYTDDSDVVQAAIHSGRLPANPPFVARCAVLELRLWPDTARYPGAVAVDGSLKSKSWNAPHDGAAFEVLRARWTSEAADTLISSIRTRKQRVRELQHRKRAVLESAEGGTLVFAAPSGRVSYKYDAVAVRNALFPPESRSQSSSPVTKRRRTSLSNAFSVPSSPASSSHGDVVLRTASPSTLVVFRLEEASPSAAASVAAQSDDSTSTTSTLVNATNISAKDPASKLNGHITTAKPKRKRSAPVSTSSERYTVSLRRHSPTLKFREPPRPREEQERLYGAFLRGPPSPTPTPPLPDGDTLLTGVRDTDVEFLPQGIALWSAGKVCFIPVASWSSS